MNLSLGERTFGSGELQFPERDRFEHMLAVGLTGTGKSKFLERLVRQDIANWHRTGCGMLLIDPHGSLFDNIMQWLTWNQGVLDVPVVPIDFRRDDWIVSYNLLRKRERGDPAVAIRQLVDAMAHVWGKSGTDETPLFSRWASNLMRTIYANNGTILDSYALLDQYLKHVRVEMLRSVTNENILRDWRSVHHLSTKDFEAQVGSLVNRLHRFLETDLIRLVMGGCERSLDMRRALDEGQIILVSLGTENGLASDEDTQLMATLLLTDLWTAAKERGKRDGVKPFRLYIDEFQNFLIPAISKNLDQARGFGLQLHLAHQFPNQLLHGGPHGKAIYDSVLANARTKIVFQLQGEENVKPLAQALFTGTMDPNKIKHQIFSTRVLDYSQIETESTSWSESESSGEGDSESRSRADRMDDFGNEGALLEGDESAPQFPTLSEGVSTSRNKGRTVGKTSGTMLVPILGQEESSRQYESLEEQMFRAMRAIAALPNRHFIAKISSSPVPEMGVVPAVRSFPVEAEDIDRCLGDAYAKLDFAIPRQQAVERIEARRQMILNASATFMGDGEPTTAKRKLLE